MDKQVNGFTDAALQALADYHWPGNVRELRNAIERSLLTCGDQLIGVNDLPEKVHTGHTQIATPSGELVNLGEASLDDWLTEAERNIIMQALEECDGIQVNAARLLGISERSLWHRVKKLNIQVSRKVNH